MTVLSVENLTISYRTARQWREVVHNVSFTSAGEMLAFVGESGSGKTTTAQAIIGLLADNARRDAGKSCSTARRLAGGQRSVSIPFAGRESAWFRRIRVIHSIR
jgi:peptide/nickel transport system ATP-binding protein